MVAFRSFACVLCLLSLAAAKKKVKDPRYYKILEVPTDVSDAKLRKAYHKLALKWHPDKHTSKSDAAREEAESKFKDISLAYDTLSDKKKRRHYDQVGEDGLKRGQQPGNQGGGGHDPFNIFEQFFNSGFGGGGFGGGGGFNFNFNMGGGGRRHGLFADHSDEVETLQDESRLKEVIAYSESETDPEMKQSVVILCVDSNGDCRNLESGLAKLAKSHKGAVTFYAADCINAGHVCSVAEPNVQRYPCIIYYGYKKRVPYNYGSGEITTRSVRLWLAQIVPDRLVQIRTERDYESFSAGKRYRASVVYLTEKVAVPPRLKALSMEFEGRISIAVLSKQDKAFKAVFGSRQAVPEVLPVFFDMQTEEFVSKTGPELEEFFESLVTASQQNNFQELTSELYDSGVCNVMDYRFCLLAMFPTAVELEAEQKRGNLLSIGEEYASEQTDPLRIVYVLGDTTPQQHPRLWAMLSQSVPAWVTSNGVLLWRPKWRRFDVFDGEVADADALSSFVRSAFVRAALDGDRSLSVEHPEF